MGYVLQIYVSILIKQTFCLIFIFCDCCKRKKHGCHRATVLKKYPQKNPQKNLQFQRPDQVTILSDHC